MTLPWPMPLFSASLNLSGSVSIRACHDAWMTACPRHWQAVGHQQMPLRRMGIVRVSLAPVPKIEWELGVHSSPCMTRRTRNANRFGEFGATANSHLSPSILCMKFRFALCCVRSASSHAANSSTCPARAISVSILPASLAASS